MAPVYLLRISSFVTFDVLPAAVPWLAFAVGTAAALGAWRLRRDPAMRTVLICSALALPLGLCLVSLFVPVLVPRISSGVQHHSSFLLGRGWPGSPVNISLPRRQA